MSFKLDMILCVDQLISKNDFFYKFQPVLVRMKRMKKGELLEIFDYLDCIGQVIADLLCNNAMTLGTFLLVKQYLY